ncbi:MAG: hypothetical protein HY040_25520 [Planctomycetes bacterium]|nr:hypothetical protein [Planctomycetota bacterium]
MIDSHPLPMARRKRRWFIRISVAVVALAALAFGFQTCLEFSSDAELADIYAQLDRNDPNWRLEDIEAQRRQVPDEENSALHCKLVASALGGQRICSQYNLFTKLFDNLSPQAQLNYQQLKFLNERMTKFKMAVEEARKLKDMPYGRFPVSYTPDFYSTDFSDPWNVFSIQELLQWDAAILVHAGNPEVAMESCLAILNAGRALGDDPRGVFFRLAWHWHVKAALERVLAQGTPSESTLRRMQEELAKEIAEPVLRNALRGQLAAFHHLMTSLESGRASIDPLIDTHHFNVSRHPLDFMMSESVKKEHAEMLRIFMEFAEAMNLPWPEEQAAAALIQARLNRLTSAPVKIVRTLSEGDFGTGGTLGASGRRSQAHLRSTLTAIAAERYRIAHKEWPKTLDDLVAAKLLDTIPDDPFAAGPLRLKHRADGITIYSVGFDGVDNGGMIGPEPNAPKVGFDIGFRLWNPNARRQPPMPTVTIDAGDYR